MKKADLRINVLGFQVGLNQHANRTLDEVEIFEPKCSMEKAEEIVQYLRKEGFVSGEVGIINYSSLL